MQFGKLLVFVCLAALFAGCSKEEPIDQQNTTVVEAPKGKSVDALVSPPAVESKQESRSVLSEAQFDVFAEKLERAKHQARGAGQTLLEGESLVFDYDERVAQMAGNVVVLDDQGELRAQRLIGRFTASNEVDRVEALQEVRMVSQGREGRADKAVYRYSDGMIQLNGQAVVSEGENQLSGESIRFWSRGSRRMICEPNALLVVSGESGSGVDGFGDQQFDTEIRANKLVYDEELHRADLLGNVRVRDSRAAMDCEKVTIFLKEENKIDWIEALGEVIIQFEDRRALAGLVTYVADEGKFTLEKSPMVKQGRNVMTGDRIIFWQETQSMVCEPNARMLLYLDEASRAKFMKDLNN